MFQRAVKPQNNKKKNNSGKQYKTKLLMVLWFENLFSSQSKIDERPHVYISCICDISRTKQQASVDSDDEEIPSDSDDEVAGKHHTADNTSEIKVRKRKLKIEDYPEFLAKRHREFQEYRYRCKIHRYMDTQ